MCVGFLCSSFIMRVKNVRVLMVCFVKSLCKYIFLSLTLSCQAENRWHFLSVHYMQGTVPRAV